MVIKNLLPQLKNCTISGHWNPYMQNHAKPRVNNEGGSTLYMINSQEKHIISKSSSKKS
jgi:hypothetical protein